MHPQFLSVWQHAGVGLASKRSEPGFSLLSPAEDHRIIIHSSPATRTYCHETGTSHLRRRGDIDLVPAGQAGGFNADAAYDSLEVRLSPHLIGRVAAEIGRPDSGARLEMRHILRNSAILHLAQALDSEGKANTPAGALYAESIAVALALQLLRLAGARQIRPNRLSEAQLKRVLDYIDAHLDQSLTIDRLSREAGASSSHLRTWFKIATGMTVHRYVQRQRVERARSLPLQGKLSISEVAWATGFAHQSHLARWMRRELGYTPRMLQ
jgi:AraC family transcriptional regulator